MCKKQLSTPLLNYHNSRAGISYSIGSVLDWFGGLFLHAMVYFSLSLAKRTCILNLIVDKGLQHGA